MKREKERAIARIDRMRDRLINRGCYLYHTGYDRHPEFQRTLDRISAYDRARKRLERGTNKYVTTA